jgi:hypothetical protein
LLPLICDETVSNIFSILESMSCVEKSFGVAGLYGIWMARLRWMLRSWIPRVRCWSCWRRMCSCKLLHGIYFTNWSTAVWSQSLVFLSTVLTLVFSSYTMICFYPCHPAHRFLLNCRKLWKAITHVIDLVLHLVFWYLFTHGSTCSGSYPQKKEDLSKVL